MSKIKKIVSLSAILGTVPMSAFAAFSTAYTIFFTLTDLMVHWVIPILITLAVIYFIWGVIQYTVSTDEEKKKKARGAIIQGLIGLFVIIAFWGIISVVVNTFGVGATPFGGVGQPLPCVANPAAGILC